MAALAERTNTRHPCEGSDGIEYEKGLSSILAHSAWVGELSKTPELDYWKPGMLNSACTQKPGDLCGWVFSSFNEILPYVGPTMRNDLSPLQSASI